MLIFSQPLWGQLVSWKHIASNIAWKFERIELARHTVYKIVSWPNPRQRLMIQISDLRMITIQHAHIITTNIGQSVNWKHITPNIAWKISERMELILATHSPKYIWQAFYMVDAFSRSTQRGKRHIFNVQTNEYNLQIIMYPILILNNWENMMIQSAQTRKHEKIWQQQWDRLILPICSWQEDQLQIYPLHRLNFIGWFIYIPPHILQRKLKR